MFSSSVKAPFTYMQRYVYKFIQQHALKHTSAFLPNPWTASALITCPGAKKACLHFRSVTHCKHLVHYDANYTKLGSFFFSKTISPFYYIYSFSCTVFINVINLFVNHYILFLFAFYTASDRKENVILLHETFQRLQPVWINIHSLTPHWASQASSWAGWFFNFHFGFQGPDASLDSFTSHC